MKRENFNFIDPFGQTIECLKWIGDNKPKAVVQIVHGMAEHAARYDDFATFLVKNNFIVFANDHRGHGLTAGKYGNTGYFADKNGWSIVTDNVFQLSEIIKKEYPCIPLFIFGHSMGSLIVRSFISVHPNAIDGIILSGTSYNPKFLLLFGKTVANIQRFFKGKKHRSKLLDTLSFGSFNKKFNPARTKFDWLSRDNKQVDLYINDQFCGFVCTTSLFSDMFNGILKIQKNYVIAKTPAELPVYIISGEKDAVGNYTKGVKKVYELFIRNGAKDVEMKLYKECRHEILNEINKEEVYSDIVKWLNSKIF